MYHINLCHSGNENSSTYSSIPIKSVEISGNGYSIMLSQKKGDINIDIKHMNKTQNYNLFEILEKIEDQEKRLTILEQQILQNDDITKTTTQKVSKKK